VLCRGPAFGDGRYWALVLLGGFVRRPRTGVPKVGDDLARVPVDMVVATTRVMALREYGERLLLPRAGRLPAVIGRPGPALHRPDEFQAQIRAQVGTWT
jgi:hypothetical protein